MAKNCMNETTPEAFSYRRSPHKIVESIYVGNGKSDLMRFWLVIHAISKNTGENVNRAIVLGLPVVIFIKTRVQTNTCKRHADGHNRI